MIQYLQNFKQGPELPWEGLRGFSVGALRAMNPGPWDLFLMTLAAALFNMARRSEMEVLWYVLLLGVLGLYRLALTS